MQRRAGSSSEHQYYNALTRRRWYSETAPRNKFSPTLKSPIMASMAAVGLGTAVYWLYESDERTAKEAQAKKLEAESKARAQEHRERKRREALGQQSVEETEAEAEARLRAAKAKYQAYKFGSLSTSPDQERTEESTASLPYSPDSSKQSYKGWFGSGK